jgi:O-antigen/teichoic acid export membrane protein
MNIATIQRCQWGRSWLRLPAVYTVGVPALTLMGAATTVLAPSLLGPVRFGQFVLLTSVFQYTSDFDLGLSRLTDRVIALPTKKEPQYSIGDVIWARLLIATLSWLAAFFITLSFDEQWRGLSLLTITGGLLFMISNGPVAIYRASGRISEFSVAALTMQLGMGLPRLIGMATAGIVGCFATLAGWYVLTAIVFGAVAVPGLLRRPVLKSIFLAISAGAPLFAISTLWTLYLLSNRWIVSFLGTPAETGLFGLGAVLVTVGVGVVGTIAQVYYPKHLTGADGSCLASETYRVLFVTAVVIGVGMAGCRYGIPLIFPAFLAATPSAAVLLVSGLPLCLCAWLIPLVIATAGRPLLEGPIIFGTSMLVLVGGMLVGGSLAGITGLAWGCLPSAWLLLGLLECRLIRARLLSISAVYHSVTCCVLATAVGGVAWLLLFR